MKSAPSCLRLVLGSAFVLLPFLADPAFAQPAATGTIEGRVFNPATSEYTERARVRVEGTTIESFSDVDGRFQLTRVPAGAVRVQAFYTGATFTPQTVTVVPGGVAQVTLEWVSRPRRKAWSASRPSRSRPPAR